LVKNPVRNIPLFQFSSIKAKFALLVIGATLVSCLSVGLLSYEIGKQGLIEASELRLASIAGNQAKDVSNYVVRVNQTLSDIGQNTAVADAVDNIASIMSSERDNILKTFSPAGATLEQRVKEDGSSTKLIYGMRHSTIHSSLVSAWKNAKVSDIYVVNQEGLIVYSVTKGREFLQSVNDPGNEPLAKIVEEAGKSTETKDFVEGFQPYKAEDGDVSAFIGRPLEILYWGKPTRKGFVIVRVSSTKLAQVVEPEGLGSTVDAGFLLTKEGTLRAGAASFAKDGKAPADLAAAAGQSSSGSLLASDDQGSFFYSYLPISLFGENDMLVVGQEESKVLAASTKLAQSAVVATLAVLAIMGLVGAFVAARMTRPLTKLAELMNRLNAGDKSIVIEGVDRKDEIGTMARALESFRNSALEKDAMEINAAEKNREIESERVQREAEKARSAADLEAAVAALASGLKNLAGGRLSHRINTPFVASLDQLRVDFNLSMQQLEETIGAIGESVDTISGGSASLKTASESLSQRTERQAAALEETAAALGSITETLKETRGRCEHAEAVTTQTTQQASASASIVREAISAMDKIENSSQQIRQIIDVIDQIAFQTNLLALNAGVEAARAGDAGKGFAVVAQEVRELAQRSAAAAKDINALINGSAADVENGVALVLKTGEGLTKIEEGIQAISAEINGIVMASRDQSERLGEINSTVVSLDQVTQQNAAMVEETTASAHSLDSESIVLSQRISHFQIGDGRTRAIGRAA
jgi:methyl-accepting chemotaxis protein